MILLNPILLFSLYIILTIFILKHLSDIFLLFLLFNIVQVIDLLLSVNVEFMLCPTGAMTSIFSLFPPWVLYPTYRTIITYLVFIIGPLISLGYMYAANLVLLTKSSLFSTKKVPVNQSIKKHI